MKNIFAIYASQDHVLVPYFLRHLKPLERDFNASIWHDDPIYPGHPWKPQDPSRIHSADIFLFFVSDAFMHSEFVKQSEFKTVIDRYKEGKSMIIPILLDKCPWNMDFKSKDYNFNMKELQVFPEDGRPISDYKSEDEIVKHVTSQVKKLITSYDQRQLELKFAEEKKRLFEEAEVNKRVEQEIKLREAAEAKKKAEEEKRLKEEAETARKAEEEAKLREEAEAEEEQRLKEEAEAARKEEQEAKLREEAETRKKAEEEQRLKEGAEAARKEEEEAKLREEAEAKKKAEEEQRQREEAEAAKKAEEEAKLREAAEAKKKAEEEQRLKEEAEAARKEEQEAKLREEVEAKKKAEEEQRLREEEQRLKVEAEAARKEEQKAKLREEVEAKKKAEEEQRLREEAEAKKKAEDALWFVDDSETIGEENQEMRLREEAEAIKKAGDAQWFVDDAEAKKKKEKFQEQLKAEKKVEQEKKEKALREEAVVKRRAEKDQKRLLEESKKLRLMQEDSKIKKTEAAIKTREEEWRKFKEEADAKANQGPTDRPGYIPETNESFIKTPQTQSKRPKRKVLAVLLIGSLAIVGFWLFPVFNNSSETIPVLQNSETTGIEDDGGTVRPETDTNGETVIQGAGGTVIPETEAEDQIESSSALEVGSNFDEGVVFTLDSSGKSGKIAHTEDAGPMTWENAMNIHEQFGEGWRLPTMDELSEMYASIGPGANNSGQFADGLYWSSTPYDENQARLLRFSDGNTTFHYNNRAEYRKFLVRAVRDFSR